MNIIYYIIGLIILITIIFVAIIILSPRTVVGWGNNYFKQVTIPSGLINIKAISAGGFIH